jgi:hypothetical protein
MVSAVYNTTYVLNYAYVVNTRKYIYSTWLVDFDFGIRMIMFRYIFSACQIIFLLTPQNLYCIILGVNVLMQYALLKSSAVVQ